MFLALGATVVVACSSDDSADNGADTTAEPPSTDTTTTTSPVTSPPSTTPPDTTAAPEPTEPTVVEPEVDLPSDPFTLGVSSGDPEFGSVVLWTRLKPADVPIPLDEVPVIWELAADTSFDQITASGSTMAEARFGHSVHALVNLDGPAWYRFRVGEWTSPIGRCQSAPSTGAASLKIASASCQHWETGFYAAYRDMAEWEPDLVVHVGDFIYEGAGTPDVAEGRVRTHGTAEPVDVDGYRTRYELYLSDPDLQSARAACPWAVVWDDHEVDNNYANLMPERPEEADTFQARRDAAYQVWWEHMPVRLDPPQPGEDFPIHRTLRWGDLADVVLLDGRQYRDDQACGDTTLSFDPPCDEAFAPERSMLGADQEAWLAEQLGAATGAWTVVAQQTVMSRITAPNGAILNYDQWDGYPFARQRLYDTVRESGVGPIVVLTGDIHLAGVGRLVDDNGVAMGTEWVTTSISSAPTVPDEVEDLVALFPDVVEFEIQHRGYTRHTIDRDAWEAEYRIVDDVAQADSPVGTWKTFTLAAGSTEVVTGS